MKLKQTYCRWSKRILGLSIIFCTFLGAYSAPFVKSYIAQTQTLSVNDHRPLAAAMEVLEGKYGAIITYEDAPYIHETDVEDQTSMEWKQSHPNGPRALVPKGGSLEISYQISQGSVRSDEMRSLIQKLLDLHAEKNNPGRFRLQQDGDIFHITPTQVRDSSGGMMSVGSILDATVSFPEQERTALSTLRLITDAVGRAKGVKFVVGTVPMNLFHNTTLRLGASSERARDILVSIIRATKSKLSWQIFYDPGIKWYVLNVYGVR